MAKYLKVFLHKPHSDQKDKLLGIETDLGLVQKLSLWNFNFLVNKW